MTPKNIFCPDSWILTPKLRDYARNKGLVDKQIDDQEEAFRLHQHKDQIHCWDRAWQRWVRKGIEWGKVVPVSQPSYRKPEAYTDEQRKADEAKAWADLNRLRTVK